MKILAIGAHPADVIDLAGGTLFMHRNKNDSVKVIVFTDGAFSHTKNIDSFDPEIEQLNKREEVKKACLKLKINDIVFIGEKDEPLTNAMNSHNIITEIIREYKPDMILTHHPNEYSHFDHAEVGKVVCRAIKSAIKQPSKERHFTPNVYFFGVQFRPESARLGFNPIPPTILIDIGSVIKYKQEALFCLASQGLNDMEALQQRFNSFESEMGRADGIRYSEGFISYYPIKSFFLPTSINTSFYTNKEVK